MKRDIVQRGSFLLRERSSQVSKDELGETKGVCADLQDTLAHVMSTHVFRDAAGISAVQIGVLRRVCLLWFPNGGFQWMVNPLVVDKAREIDLQYEGCLSFFDRRGLVPRPTWIVSNWIDIHGQRIERRLAGWKARIVLHEIDHMDGVLYDDRMKPEDRLVTYDEYCELIGRPKSRSLP